MDVAEAFDTVFLSTPSARRATGRPVLRWYEKRISIHALCEEGDPGTPWSMEPPRIFLSTPSARRATAVSRAASCIFFQFLSTPSARRATRCPCGLHVLSHISIHALCEEGDLPGRAYGLIYNISIHALCEEGDNPTATYESIAYNFYPRPLRGGRRIFPKRVYSNIRHFYPRPLRGGRREHFGVVSPDAISIHALCEEGDALAVMGATESGDFYPRPLRGGRRFSLFYILRQLRFLSTPSARRATHFGRVQRIHPRDFYPRPLRGGRPGVDTQDNRFEAISIHALCEEGDLLLSNDMPRNGDFYPRPLRGGRHEKLSPCTRSPCNFYPRPLRGGRPASITRAS